MRYRYEILAHERLHEGFFRFERYRLRHELYRGGMSEVLEREVLERGDAVALVPYDPVADRVVLVEQFRVGALRRGPRPWMLEVVAGMVEPGESTEEVVRRECREEAGLEVRELEPAAGFLSTPGGSTEHLTLYCGRVDARGAGGVHGHAGEGEDIRVRVFDAPAAFALVDDGTLISASTAVGLLWLAVHRERLRRRWLEG